MCLLPQDLSNGWTAELDFPTYDPLTADTQADIVVVGGGYTGLPSRNDQSVTRGMRT